MKSRDFCYWLQGYLELAPTGALTKEQTECIQKHLALVFKHEIDPSFHDAKELDKIHSGAVPSPHGMVYRC